MAKEADAIWGEHLDVELRRKLRAEVLRSLEPRTQKGKAGQLQVETGNQT